jgi:hypothetical protein
MIDSRVRKRFDAIISEHRVLYSLCHGRGWNWDTFSFCMAVTYDQATGYYECAVNNEEMALLVKCANELPRPHNRSVVPPSYSLNSEPPKPEFFEDGHKGLPGPNPHEGATVEFLYEQVRTWAEDVLEMWKKALVLMAFESFWTEGKERGFLWEDVKAMALQTKKHKGGIKWHNEPKPR